MMMCGHAWVPILVCALSVLQWSVQVAVYLSSQPSVEPFYPGAAAPLPSPNGTIDASHRLRLLSGRVFGVESIACSHAHRSEGLPSWCVGGGADGWLIRLGWANGEEGEFDISRGIRATRWLYVGGRPLGLHFHLKPDGTEELWVCEALKGLLRINAETKAIEVVASITPDGVPIRYANDLDVSSAGDVYFSDSTSLPPQYIPSQGIWSTMDTAKLDISSGVGRGRLLVWRRRTRQVEVLLDGLRYSNGVALSHDETHVLVVETGHYRVLQLNVVPGQRADGARVLIDSLPGFPDGLCRTAGGYWLSLLAPRSAPLDAVHPYAMVKQFSSLLPHWLTRTRPWAAVIKLTQEGRIDGVYQGAGAQISSVAQYGSHLMLGNLYGDEIGLLDP